MQIYNVQGRAKDLLKTMFQTTRNKKSFLLQHKLICCYDNKLPYFCLNLIILHVNILINTCFCPPEPNVIRVIVDEGSDVILPCSLSSKESIVSKRFEWKKDDQKTVFIYDSGIHSDSGSGRVSHFDDKLKSGNASITIRNTKVADSGNYTCDFPQLQPRQIFHIKLHVGECFYKTLIY